MDHGYQKIDSNGEENSFGYLINIKNVGWWTGEEGGGTKSNLTMSSNG